MIKDDRSSVRHPNSLNRISVKGSVVAGCGVHIILGRDDAKQLFAQKGDAAVREFVTKLSNSRKHREARLVMECGRAWEGIHRCLSDGTLDPEGGEFPLNHCILGGRRLHEGKEFEAILVRPDIVPFVAESMHLVKRTQLHEKYFALTEEQLGHAPSEQEFDTIWTCFQFIRQLYEDASQDRAAVLFTVEH